MSEKHSDTLAQGDNLVQSEILAQSDTLAENLFCIFLCLITKVTARFWNLKKNYATCKLKVNKL